MVSVIIVNYNTKEITVNCISSILKFTKDVEFEIIVVDNASTDGSQETLRARYPQIQLIENKENLGFGRANNKGAIMSKGDYLFFLNSDTLLIQNSIKTLFDFFKSKEKEFDLGALGCLLVNKNKKINGYGSHFPNCNEEIIKLYRKVPLLKPLFKLKEVDYPLDQEYFEIDYVIGADLMMNRKTFETLGGFSTDYFMYYEESDLQLRLKHLNKKSLILTTTKIIHLEEGSAKVIKNYNNAKRIIAHKSKNIFLRKHDPQFKKYKFFDLFFLWLNILNWKYRFQENVKYVNEISNTYN